MGLARALQATGANYALIGGYAVAAHGYNRFSEDVDLLVDRSPANTPKWVAALATLPDRAAKELEGDPEIFEREGHYATYGFPRDAVDVRTVAARRARDALIALAAGRADFQAVCVAGALNARVDRCRS
jgi:hypothetical protein